MFRASPQQVKDSLETARKLSRHYSCKFPEVDYDEFYSISQVAIAQALKTYKPAKGKLHTWVSHYIYSRFHDYLTREYKKQKNILIKISRFEYFYIEAEK